MVFADNQFIILNLFRGNTVILFFNNSAIILMSLESK
jgi:hypothetical protein